MRAPEPDLSKLRNNGFNLTKTTAKPTVSAVGNQHPHRHLDEFALYTSFFSRLPNAIQEKKIDAGKAHAWFVKEYEQDITDFYFSKRCYGNCYDPLLDDCYYFLADDLLVYFDIQQNLVKVLFKKTPLEQVETFLNGLRKFRKRKWAKPQLSLLVQTSHGVDVKTLEVTRSRMKLEDHYNDDFPDAHQTILKRLRKKNDKGIVLLHGKPGTGKTSYIRYLVSKVKKHVIFLPVNLAQKITNPDLLTVLIDNPDSILVIEDAENLILDRERSPVSPVATLLNISDGLLSDCLNIQIICSFNTDISRIDSALIRKGRLIAKYEFKPLSIDKARQLSQKLGYYSEINHQMSLSEVYNQEEKDMDDVKTEKKIGFRSLQAS